MDWSFLKNQKFWLTLAAIVSAFAVLLWPEKTEFINLILPLFVALIFSILGIDAIEAWWQRAYARDGVMEDDEFEARTRAELRRYGLLPYSNVKPAEPPK